MGCLALCFGGGKKRPDSLRIFTAGANLAHGLHSISAAVGMRPQQPDIKTAPVESWMQPAYEYDSLKHYIQDAHILKPKIIEAMNNGLSPMVAAAKGEALQLPNGGYYAEWVPKERLTVRLFEMSNQELFKHVNMLFVACVDSPHLIAYFPTNADAIKSASDYANIMYVREYSSITAIKMHAARMGHNVRAKHFYNIVPAPLTDVDAGSSDRIQHPRLSKVSVLHAPTFTVHANPHGGVDTREIETAMVSGDVDLMRELAVRGVQWDRVDIHLLFDYVHVGALEYVVCEKGHKMDLAELEYVALYECAELLEWVRRKRFYRDADIALMQADVLNNTYKIRPCKSNK